MEHWEKGNHSWSKDSSRFILTPSDTTKKLFFYIQEIGQFKANKPYFTEREHLKSFLIKFTLSGEGSLRYANDVYQLKAGDVFFIDCNNHQYYQTESDEPWEMDWVHFYGSTSANFYIEFIRTGTHVFHTSGPPEKNRIHLIMEHLQRLQQNKNSKTDFETSILLHELLNELIQQKFQLDFDEAEIPPYIAGLKVFLDANYKQKITLENLEKIYHINRYQLTKEFSRYIGHSPIDYVITKKISLAKDMLHYSGLTVQEISLATGIDNTAYFSRLFKKKTGISPAQYRKTMR